MYQELVSEAWKALLAVVAAGLLALAALLFKRVVANVVEAYKKSTASQTEDVRVIVKEAVDPLNREVEGTRGDIRTINRNMTLAAEALALAREESTTAMTEQSKRIDKVQVEVEDLKGKQDVDRADLGKLKTEVAMLQRNQGQRTTDQEIIEKMHPSEPESGNGRS